MHPPRIPLDFGLSYGGYGRVHIASGDTGIFWFGVLLVIGGAWNLCAGIRSGDFGTLGFLGEAIRDHAATYWMAAAINLVFVLAGLDFVVSGLIGIKPFSIP